MDRHQPAENGQGQRPHTLHRIFRPFLPAAFLVGLFRLLSAPGEAPLPLAAAFILAYLMNPLASRLQKWLGNRSLAVFAALLPAGGFLAGLL